MQEAHMTLFQFALQRPVGNVLSAYITSSAAPLLHCDSAGGPTWFNLISFRKQWQEKAVIDCSCDAISFEFWRLLLRLNHRYTCFSLLLNTPLSFYQVIYLNQWNESSDLISSTLWQCCIFCSDFIWNFHKGRIWYSSAPSTVDWLGLKVKPKLLCVDFNYLAKTFVQVSYFCFAASYFSASSHW